MYKLSDVPVKQLFATYPELEVIYDEAATIHKSTGSTLIEHSPLSKEELMYFIVLSYHLHSKLARESSIHKRRRQALSGIGIEITEKSSQGLVALVLGKNEFVNRLALIFCKYENSPAWIELCAIQDILDDVFLTLKLESEGTEKKSANEMLKIKLEVNAKAESLRQKSKQLSAELFMGDSNLNNLSASQMLLEERIKIITPERFVKAQREKHGA